MFYTVIASTEVWQYQPSDKSNICCSGVFREVLVCCTRLLGKHPSLGHNISGWPLVLHICNQYKIIVTCPNGDAWWPLKRHTEISFSCNFLGSLVKNAVYAPFPEMCSSGIYRWFIKLWMWCLEKNVALWDDLDWRICILANFESLLKRNSYSHGCNINTLESLLKDSCLLSLFCISLGMVVQNEYLMRSL